VPLRGRTALLVDQKLLYRMQEKAHGEVKQGHFELASKTMKQLATNLLSLGEQDLAQTAMVEAENIEKKGVITSAGSKKIKYGTRALIAPDTQENAV
jgi:Ca-activated chloride channel family protein